MNTSQLGFDLFLERDECKADEDIFRENLFNDEYSSQNGLFKTDFKNIEANFGSFKQSADMNFDIFDNFFVKPELSSPPLIPSSGDLGFDVPDFNNLKEIGDFIAFDGILNDFNESASDSGISNNDVSPETMLSPSSGFTSPDPREDMSVDTNDTNSEVSSASDLGSLGSLGNSPERIGPNTTPVGVNNFLATSYNHNKIYLDDDDSDMPEVNSQNSIVLSDQLPNFGSHNALPVSTLNSSSNVVQTTTTVIPRIKFETVDQSKLLNLKNTKVTKVRIENSFSGTKSNCTPTYVVTQAGKGTSLLSSGTILKSPIGGRSLLLPVKLNDLNKVRTIKIISTSSANSVKTGTGVRTVVSTSRPATTLTTTPHSGPQRATAFFTTTKGSDGRPLLKVAPTALVSPNTTCSLNTELRKGAVTPAPAVYTIKEEPENSDDEIPTNNQRLLLSDEERRMMRKEGLVLPSHLPLTKQEERDLKRIKRKIRNKISAQDSRKRKKEYVDGLEDRIKMCTDENQQLQKRIRHLEKQNETLVVQLKRFHSLLGNTSNNRHTHASTALMMLILSAALIVVPSIRPSSQDGQGENELSLNSKIPSSGHSRSLLEVGTNQKMTINNPLDVFDSVDEDDLDPLAFTSALSDHDYAPLAKKPHLESDHNLFFLPTGMEKPFSKADGDPPDGKGGTSGVAALFGAMLEKFGSNRTDPGGFVSNITNKTPQGSFLRNTESSVVVNLSRDRRFRDDIELE